MSSVQHVPAGQRFNRGTRAVLGLGPSLLYGGLATGTLGQMQWGERGLELSPGAAVAIGIVLFAGVGAAVLSLTRRNRQFEGTDGDRLESETEPETETETPPVLTGDAIEGAQVALRSDDGDWRWRVLRREALAESPARASTRSTATDRIERTRDAIDAAGLREVTDAAVRVYRDEDGSWRWTLGRADGSRVGSAAEGYDDREAAEAAVRLVKDCGPEADVVDVEEGAITIAKRRDRWQWQLVDDERTPLAAGADGYERRTDAVAAADTFVDRIADARVLDVDAFGVELYESGTVAPGPKPESGPDRESELDQESKSNQESETEPGEEENGENGTWAWRLVDEDSDIIADAPSAFETRPAAEDAATAALAALEDTVVTDAGEPAFERYPDAAGDADRSRTGDDDGAGSDGDAWRWRLVDDAGRTVARAPDAASTVDEVERATELIREAVSDAPVLEIDEAAYEAYSDPDSAPEDNRVGDRTEADSGGNSRNDESDAAEGTTAVADGTGTETAGARWRWRLVTADRDVVAESAASYSDAADATTALERIREDAREADVVAFKTAAFRVYENDDGDWRWRLLDEGGAVLGDSDGEHDSRNEAIEAMLTLKERAPDADVVEIDAPEFELFTDEDGVWAWRLIDAAGRRVATAPTTYASRAAARAAVDRFRGQSDSPVHAVEGATFQPAVADGAWRWRLVHPTGETLAVSGSEYPTRDELEDRIDDVRETAAAARSYTTGAVTVQLVGSETWRWRLLDRDREPILESATAYSSRAAARDAVDELEKASMSAVPIFAIDAGAAAVWLEQTDEGWRWDLIDRGREVLATAVETADKSDTTAAVDDIQRLAPLAERIDVAEASFDVVERDDGWRWRLLDGDGHPVAIGDETTETKAAARDGIDDVRSLLESASVFELEGPAFERYRTNGDEPWQWRLVDENGETLLESAQAYETREATQEAIAALQSHATDGKVTVAE
ncbi:DUF1508 domain-containing protein [Halopiger xanaduensis]|uniref:DUF1508 domain-containing protein n=1 Tax=Halopiger xanaduensis TaxID=387343 RepID=UPI00149482F9|nr:DUF1508 domain-containing protein [Halopiger xanaduensis]